MAEERSGSRGSEHRSSGPHDDEDREPSDGEQDSSKPGLLTRYPFIRYGLIVALIAGIVVAAIWYLNYRERGQYRQSTNNAYVRADFVTISPKLGGYVEQVLVSDNQPVRRGQLLAVLDPRDYRAGVTEAQAQVAAADAGIRTARRTLDEQRASILQADAQVASAAAVAAAAANEVRRYEPLAQSGAESRERLAALVLDRDRAVANLRAQRAAAVAETITPPAPDSAPIASPRASASPKAARWAASAAIGFLRATEEEASNTESATKAPSGSSKSARRSGEGSGSGTM